MAAMNASQESESARKLLPELFQLLRPHLSALDAFLEEQIASFEPEIREQVNYCIDTSGKRIRPSLIFFSGWKNEEFVDPNLVKLAGIVEIIHLATLVHDDIMDEADMRRKQDTVAKKYGNTTAVLLGDALFSHAVYLSTQFPTNEVCEQVAVAMRNVCSGEIMQTMQRGDPDITLEGYQRVINLKTAELFRVSCSLGAALAGEPTDFCEAAGKFGMHLGMAYQIYDDLTDFFGIQQTIGKTLGTDLATGKATLPLILMRDRLSGTEKEDLRETLCGNREPNVEYWLNKMATMGIFMEVRKAIFDEIRQARSKIEPYQNLASQSLLLTISDLIWNQVETLKSDQASN